MEEHEKIEHEKDVQKILNILNGMTHQRAHNVLRGAINKLDEISIVTSKVNES